MVQIVRPENALKRAQELVAVGKEQDGLDTLHEVIRGRKGGRQPWTRTHEDIIGEHLRLCVKLKKVHTAKDALYQYRNMVQQVEVKSLERVIDAFLESAEKRVESAKAESTALAIDVDDLDQADTPENLLLSAVSAADTQNRADRAVLSPWLRFLWDSYRNCLELLRNNAQVEPVYHKIARKAFAFCMGWERRSEFRKLCDNLRAHLAAIQKQQHYAHGVKLNNPETLAMIQETRLSQLDVAIRMDLWQEAYKSAEDVHAIMSLAREKDKRMVRPPLLVAFYDKLALVFWKSSNPLFHAAALVKLFQMCRDMKRSFGSEEQSHQATRCLLAILSISPGAELPSDLSRHLDMEEVASQNHRQLAMLLDLKAMPTRRSLLKDAHRLSIIDVANPTAVKLHRWLENEFAPLRMATTVDEIVQEIEGIGKDDYTQYIQCIRHTAAIRALKQSSQVYETLSLDRLAATLPSMGDAGRLEAFVLNCAKMGLVQARVDHRNSCVHFAGGAPPKHGEHGTGADEEPTEADGTVIDKVVPADELRHMLQSLYAALEQATDTISTKDKVGESRKLIDHAVQVCTQHGDEYHKRLLDRRTQIESYKEKREKESIHKRDLEQQQAAKLEKQRMEEEQKALQRQQKKMSEMRRQQEQDEFRLRMHQDKIAKLKESAIGAKLLEELGDVDLDKMDADDLVRQQRAKMDKERRDLADRALAVEKKWDHYVRAVHEMEAPMRKQCYDEWRKNDELLWLESEAARVQKETEEYDNRTETWERLQRVVGDAQNFLQNVRDRRVAELQKRTDEWEKLVEEEKKKRREKLKKERMEKARAEWTKRKERRDRDREQEKRDREQAERRSQLAKPTAPSVSEADAGQWRRPAAPQSVPPPQPVAAKVEEPRDWRSERPAAPAQAPPPVAAKEPTPVAAAPPQPAAPTSYVPPSARGSAYVPPSLARRGAAEETGAAAPERAPRVAPTEREVRPIPVERDMRGPPVERDMRGPPIERDMRGPPIERDMRGPPIERDMRGPPIERDMRGSQQYPARGDAPPPAGGGDRFAALAGGPARAPPRDGGAAAPPAPINPRASAFDSADRRPYQGRDQGDRDRRADPRAQPQGQGPPATGRWR